MKGGRAAEAEAKPAMDEVKPTDISGAPVSAEAKGPSTEIQPGTDVKVIKIDA
jgi:hypothetical protein